MRNQNIKGISLIETLIAGTLSTLVGIMGYKVLIIMMKGQTRTMNSANIRMVGESALSELKRQIGNSVYLSPPEGLESPADNAYPGVGAVRDASHAPGCVYESIDSTKERFSILRFTAFEYKTNPVPTMRAWHDDTDFSTPLRVAYHAEDLPQPPVFAFQMTPYPSEIYIIDADSLSMQRFRLTSPYVVNEVDTSFDPQDDTDRSPLKFSYRKVHLARPTTVTGTAHPAFDNNYVTGSVVYAVKTYLVCKSTDGKLILKEEAPGGETRVLMDPAPLNAELDRLEFRYYGTAPATAPFGTGALLFSEFFLFPYFDAAKRMCINNISVEMDFATVPASSSKLEHFRELITLHSFNSRRPKACR